MLDHLLDPDVEHEEVEEDTLQNEDTIFDLHEVDYDDVIDRYYLNMEKAR